MSSRTAAAAGSHRCRHVRHSSLTGRLISGLQLTALNFLSLGQRLWRLGSCRLRKFSHMPRVQLGVLVTI